MAEEIRMTKFFWQFLSRCRSMEYRITIGSSVVYFFISVVRKYVKFSIARDRVVSTKISTGTFTFGDDLKSAPRTVMNPDVFSLSFPLSQGRFLSHHREREKKADKGTRSLPAKVHHVTDGNRCIRRCREKPNRNLLQRADSLADGARQNKARRACVLGSVDLSCISKLSIYTDFTSRRKIRGPNPLTDAPLRYFGRKKEKRSSR